MAKRSDFAQKLLDDLRLRKEKLGYVTSSGHQAAAPPPSADSHGNSLMSTRRTGEAMKKNTSSECLAGRQATGLWFSTERNKAAVPEFAEKQIVPAGRVASIHNSVDVSMALALALSSSGKLHYVAKFGNELIPQNESIYYGETSNQQLLHSMKHHHPPFLSNLQMEEISKGVRNLNKILATGCDKSDFGKDSAQIGRALLKGTMDLEESLNMLVTLQEASDYTVGSQGRQVRVLKGKEEEDESSNGRANRKNLLCKTRISCDGSGKGKDDTTSQRIQCKSGHNDEISNSNCKVKSSTSTGIKPMDSKSNSSGSLKMPSIIAKLMGLEELPTSKAEVKKVDSNPKKEMELDRTSNADAEVRKGKTLSSQKYDEQRILTEKLVDDSEVKSSKEKTNHIQKLRLSPNYAPNRETNMRTANVDMNHSLKERIMRTANVDMNHSLKERITENNLGHSRDESGKRGEQRGQRCQLVAQEKRPNLETDQQRAKKKSPWSQNKMSGKTNAFLKQNDRGEDVFGAASNQNNTPVPQQKTTVPMSKTKCPLRVITKEKDHDRNNKQKVSKAMKDDDQKCTDSIGRTNTNQVSCGSPVLTRNRGAGKDGDEMQQAKEHQEMQIELKKTSDNLEPNRTAEKRTDDMKPVQTHVQLMKPLHIPTAKKLGTEIMKLLHEGESHSEFEESCSSFIKIPYKKNQSSFLNDLEKRWKERTNKDRVTTVNYCETKSEQQLEKAVSSTLTLGDSSANTGRVKTQEEMSIEKLKGSDLNNEASQQQQVLIIVDLEPQISNLEEMQKEGATGDRNHDNCNLLKLQDEAISEANAQGSLSKAEHLLKQLLINNQNFLNSAQSLFKIKIPVGAPQTDNEKYPKEGNMLLLDCGCELVRRKGKREGIHDIAGHYSAGRVRHLNVLVKELNDDIESLKFPSMSALSDDSSAEFLHMMIEWDMENRRPDANCMWDIGWSRSIFSSHEKDEIVRDLEKHVLGALISELLGE